VTEGASEAGLLQATVITSMRKISNEWNTDHTRLPTIALVNIMIRLT
jgi:hypothetical protein